MNSPNFKRSNRVVALACMVLGPTHLSGSESSGDNSTFSAPTDAAAAPTTGRAARRSTCRRGFCGNGGGGGGASGIRGQAQDVPEVGVVRQEQQSERWEYNHLFVGTAPDSVPC